MTNMICREPRLELILYLLLFLLHCKVDSYDSLYSMNYSEFNSGRSCAFATISSSSCVDGACSNTMNLLTTSMCPNTTDISVSVSISDSFAYGYFPTSKQIKIGLSITFIPSLHVIIKFNYMQML